MGRKGKGVEGRSGRVDWRIARVGRLECDVSAGFWPEQYSITIQFEAQGRKQTIRTLAHESDVHLSSVGKPKAGEKVPGELRVRILSEFNDWVLVGLPQETLNSGPKIRVPRELLLGEIRELMPAM